MKLLTSLLPHRVRALPAGFWFTLVVLGCLAGLEVAGRVATSDVHDGLAGFALLAMSIAIAARHRREPLSWVRAIVGWGRRWVGSVSWLQYDHGIDLRGSPPVRRRTPPLVWVAVVGLALWAVVAGAAWAVFPAGWRAIGAQTWYVLYLVTLLLLWAALLACIMVGLCVPVAVIGRWLKGWVGETDRRGAELAAVVGYAVLVSAVAFAVSPIWVLALCLVVSVVAWVAAVPRATDGPAVLWRSGPDRPIYAVPLHRVLSVTGALIALLVFNVLLMACGGRLFGPPVEEVMPVTALLGALAAWFVPGLLGYGLCRLWVARRNDPSRQAPGVVHVSGGDQASRRRAAIALRRSGWRVAPDPAIRQPGTVGIELVTAERSEANEFDPQWPLRVSEEDLATGDVCGRLQRRDEIQVRRQLFRGLSKLFKRANAFKGPGGGGYWLAPHWWFIEGLGRDDGEGPEDGATPPVVGPPYQRALPTRARQQAYRVLRATQVDMIFVEDGVGYRKVEKVLRVLLELYDVHAGRRRAEELHFRGLPKVRVMIHDYEPDNPFRSDQYPEPKFDDLSRVRVLHIFRDRGGHEELVEPPFDTSWTPAPVGMFG